MSTFILLNPEEIEQWHSYSALHATQLHWHMESLASYEAAELNRKRLQHLEGMDQFDTVDLEIQNILRFPFSSSFADHLKKCAEGKVKVASIGEELLELKDKLKL